MSSRVTSCSVAYALALALSGCIEGPTKKFVVRMSSPSAREGGASSARVRREITLWLENAGPKDKLSTERLERIYGKPKTVESGKFTFEGTFQEMLPADIDHHGMTNWGFVTQGSCSLGRVTWYTERMTGRTNLLEVAEKVGARVDLAMEVWISYAESLPELKKEPARLEKLRGFLRQKIGPAIKDLLLTYWLSGTRLDQATGSNGVEFMVRPLAKLVEEGYVPADFMLRGPNGGTADIVRRVLEMAAHAMGYESVGELPPGLTKLTDPNELESAFNAGLAAKGMTSDEMWSTLEELNYFKFLDPESSGTVIWELPRKPIETNGRWAEEKREVRWEAASETGPYAPQVLYAIWAEPDVDFQRAHFGRVVVSEKMIDYVSWLDSLTEDDRATWESFVKGLRPGAGVAKQVERFVFGRDIKGPATQAAAEDFMRRRGIEIVLSGLRQEKEASNAK